MPIYEFECERCKIMYEQFLSNSTDKPMTVCSSCGKEVRKVPSLGSFKLKGVGWSKHGYSSGNDLKDAQMRAKGKRFKR